MGYQRSPSKNEDVINNADYSVNYVSWGGCAYSGRFSSKTLPDLRSAGCPLSLHPNGLCGSLFHPGQMVPPQQGLGLREGCPGSPGSWNIKQGLTSLSPSDQIISKTPQKHIQTRWGSTRREGGDNAMVPWQPGGHPAVLPTLQEPSSSPTR